MNENPLTKSVIIAYFTLSTKQNVLTSIKIKGNNE